MNYVYLFVITLCVCCTQIKLPVENQHINSIGFSNSSGLPLKIEVTNDGGQKKIINLDVNGKFNSWQTTWPEIPDSLTMKKIIKVDFLFSADKKLRFDCDKYLTECNGFANPLEVKNYIISNTEIKKKVKINYFYYDINKDHLKAAK